MQKHVVFLVHGMGDYSEGWADTKRGDLKSSYENFEISKRIPFDDHFDVKEVTYNQFFDERRSAWEQKKKEISSVLVENGFTDDAVTRLLDFANVTSGDDFIRTHILDVIMYRFLPQIADQIKRHVQKEILTVTEARQTLTPPVWSIIGHSLGTAVVHDTLHAMFSHPVSNELLSHTRKPEVVVAVSNVCRVLWTDGNIFDRSTVFPHPDRTRGMCSLFLSFQHPLDPFPRIRSFHPPKTPWRNHENFNQYIFKRMDKKDITHWNVHGFDHYLSNPIVHGAIFRALLWQSAISKKELDVQLVAYRRKRIAKIASVVKELEKFDAKDVDSNEWSEITEAILSFRKLILEKEEA